jgi:endonuclease I
MKRKTLLLSILSILSFGMLTTSVFASKQNISIVYGYTTGDADTYYNTIKDSMTGFEVLTELRSIQNNRLKHRVGYDNMPGAYVRTDPGTSSNQVTSFYSGNSARYSGNMNREHVWPASKTVGGRGNDPLEDDIHMTRPTLTSENSERGNSFYTYSTEAGWDPGTYNESYRGDAARIIFYCVVADSRLSLVDKEYDASSNHTMGKLSDLLEWNLKYPVQQRERVRNEQAESLQGNRNPFIDHPEYVCKIWGNANSTTKSICAAKQVEATGITLEEHNLELNVGDTHQLSYLVEPEGATPSLRWESTYDDVVSVDENGQITAIKPGESKISVTISGTMIYDLCTVKVKGDNQSYSNSSNGCGGNIITTSTILSALSLVGIGIILNKFVWSKKHE